MMNEKSKPTDNRVFNKELTTEFQRMFEKLQKQVNSIDDKLYMYKEKEFLDGSKVMKYQIKPNKFSK